MPVPFSDSAYLSAAVAGGCGFGNPRVAMLGDHLGGSFGADMSEVTRILWPWLKIANPVFEV
jgi:hypothetical protein